MSETTQTNEEDAGSDEDFALKEDGQLTPEAEKSVWDQAVANLEPEDGAAGLSSQKPPAPTGAPAAAPAEEAVAEVKTDGSEEEGEAVDASGPTDLPSEADVRLQEALDRAAALEARLAALEGKAPEGKKSPESDKPIDYTAKVLSFLPKDLSDAKKEEVKTLLDYTEGLPTLVSALRETIRSEIFEQIRQDEVEKTAKADVSTKDAKYWGDLGTWFQAEYPEFKLEQIRGDQKFTQWAKVNDAWITDQLNRTDRFDPSGARTVFQEYMKRAHPGAPKSQPKTPGSEKRMAAARSPASLGTRSPKAESVVSSKSLWDTEVAAINAKEKSMGRRYL
jgi:hypothetical protein